MRLRQGFGLALLCVAVATLGTSRLARGEEAWPELPFASIPGPESPWDHPKGSLFIISTRGLFFKDPSSVRDFSFDNDAGSAIRNQYINRMIKLKKLEIIKPGHVFSAIADFRYGQGLVYDKFYGKGYLVLDYSPSSFQEPLSID